MAFLAKSFIGIFTGSAGGLFGSLIRNQYRYGARENSELASDVQQRVANINIPEEVYFLSPLFVLHCLNKDIKNGVANLINFLDFAKNINLSK